MFNPMPSPFAAQAAELQRVLQQILQRRADLQLSELGAALHAHAASTVHSPMAWAQHCLERTRRGEPLPWEPGTSGADVTCNDPN